MLFYNNNEILYINISYLCILLIKANYIIFGDKYIMEITNHSQVGHSQ